MTSVLIQSGLRVPRSPWDVIAVVGLAAKGDGVATLIGSLSEAIAKYGERLSLSKISGKGIEAYGLVDAIETIYSYTQLPIIAVNASPGVAYVPLAAKSYTFVNGKITVDSPNIAAPVTVKSVDNVTTYETPADYTIDTVKGEITRVTGGTIPNNGTVSIVFSAPSFETVDWVAAIGRVVPVLNRNPTIITLAGVEVTSTIATALDASAIALGAINIYTQPGVSATAAAPLLNTISSVAVYPARTGDRGIEESGVHLAAVAALIDYWETPEGDPVKGNSAALTIADAALLAVKGVSWLSDRVRSAIATNGTPFNVARLRAKAQFIANKIAVDWQQKPFDLIHLEGFSQAVRDALNREPEASLLPYSTVNYSSEKSSTADRRLVYDITLKGDNGADRIAEIIVYVA